MLRKVLPLLVSAILTVGCTTAPDGSSHLTPEGQIALETSAKIAVRHLIADSPRGAEKAANVRAIVVRLQGVLTAESTLGALKDEVKIEIAKLNLSPVDLADANDLLDLFAAALEGKLGPDALKSEGVVRVSEFLTVILAALPA